MKTLLCAALISLLPGAAFAEEPAAVPTADVPVAQEQAVPAPNLTPSATPAQPEAQPAVQEATRCGMHHGCAGGRHKVGGIVLVGVTATVLTAVAVGVAVGFATHHDSSTGR